MIKNYNPAKLKEIRESLGLSLTRLAKLVNLNKSTLSRIETGQYTARNTNTIEQIMYVLKEAGAKNTKEILVPTRIKGDKTEIIKKQEANKMLSSYTMEYFNLEKDPFVAGSVPENEIFFNKNFESLYNAIVNAAQKNAFLLITGWTGSGKSTILSAAIKKLQKNRRLKLVIPNPLNTEDIDVWYLTAEFIETLGGLAKTPFLKRIRTFELSRIFKECKKNNIKICLIIDDAQDLPDKTLITLKRVWEGQGVHTGKISIILVSQPGIDGKLNRTKLEEVERRMDQINLFPFNSENEQDMAADVLEYVNHRLKNAGCKSNIFKIDAIKCMLSRIDTVQDVNVLCKKALNKAAETGEKFIDERIINAI
jgi:type II secretory pathway predicted ATPase ExeA/DNA-binding XRE family transcriptional regulator